MYGQGPMQLGMLGQNNPQHAQLQQARLQQEAAQRAQIQQQQAMQQRQQQMAAQQQAAQPAQQEMLQQTQPVRDNPAMQQMVDVARQQDQAVRARQIAQGQAGQQQMVLDAAGRGPGVPPPQEQPGFMQQGFSERMKNPWIQALINGGVGMMEAGSRGEGPMQAFMRGGVPMGVAGFQGASSMNEEEAKEAEQQRRDDEMYELQRRALEQRIAIGMPASGRGGRMQGGMGGSYG